MRWLPLYNFQFPEDSSVVHNPPEDDLHTFPSGSAAFCHISDPIIITQSLPSFRSFSSDSLLYPYLGECPRKPLKIWSYRFHPGLLQHNFRYPDVIRILLLPPGQFLCPRRYHSTRGRTISSVILLLISVKINRQPLIQTNLIRASPDSQRPVPAHPHSDPGQFFPKFRLTDPVCLHLPDSLHLNHKDRISLIPLFQAGCHFPAICFSPLSR